MITKAFTMVNNPTFNRAIVLILIFGCITFPTVCNSEILWQGDFEQFRFAVENNGGAFFYPDDQYWAPNSQAKTEFAYNPSQSLIDSYDSVALGTLLEFVAPPGEIQLDAVARGPDGGQNPTNGLAVNGAMEITGVDLDYTQEHGVDIKQKIVTFVTRRLEVDLDGTYTLECLLSGLDNLNFIPFFAEADHRAAYSIDAVVSLERIVYDENLFETVQGFPIQLSEANSSQTVDVALTTQNENLKDVGYQLKVQLTMVAEIDNFRLYDFSILGSLDNYYAIGTVDAPIKLRAVFTDRVKASPWINLLLLDE